MSYKSKRVITNMIAAVLLVSGYVIYALGNHAPNPSNLKEWAIVMLSFIGISIVGMIMIQILFHIALAIGIAVQERESEEQEVERIISSAMLEDEMDKFINLKSAQVGYICAGAGFIMTLVAFALGVSEVLALHILFGSFFLGSLLEGGVSIYCYERGV